MDRCRTACPGSVRYGGALRPGPDGGSYCLVRRIREVVPDYGRPPGRARRSYDSRMPGCWKVLHLPLMSGSPMCPLPYRPFRSRIFSLRPVLLLTDDVPAPAEGARPVVRAEPASSLGHQPLGPPPRLTLAVKPRNLPALAPLAVLPHPVPVLLVEFSARLRAVTLSGAVRLAGLIPAEDRPEPLTRHAAQNSLSRSLTAHAASIFPPGTTSGTGDGQITRTT
jgi:hypothetical protein